MGDVVDRNDRSDFEVLCRGLLDEVDERAAWGCRSSSEFSSSYPSSLPERDGLAPVVGVDREPFDPVGAHVPLPRAFDVSLKCSRRAAATIAESDCSVSTA